jgi:hypothetical protein
MAKGKAKRIVVSILVVLLTLILAAVLLFKLYGDQLLKSIIIAGSEKALQVGVRLDSVDLKVIAGKVDLKKMEIDNPEGYQHPTFLKLEHAYMDLDVLSLTSDTIEMDMMQLENINLVMEQKGTTNNLKEILNNLPKSEPAEPKPEKKAESAEEKEGKNFRIKVLEINNIEVKAKLMPTPGRADTVTLRLKPIRLENLGTEEKIDAAGLTAKILKAISKGVAEQGADVLPTDMTGSIGDELGKQGEALLKGSQDIGGLFKKKEKEE